MAVRSTRRLTVVTGVSALLAFGLTGAAAASVGGHTTGTAAVTGARPSWATSARDAGPAAASDHVSLRVWLSLRDPAAVARLVKAVTNPASPEYGHYLTPAQFEARYAPTAGQASAVASWLRTTGLQVTVPATHRYVAASGSVSQVEHAFGVSLNNYTVGTHTWRAPANSPAVPSSLRSTVLTITGLDTGNHSMRPAIARPQPPPAGFRNSPPFSSSYGALPATDQVDGTTPLPRFNGATLPYVVQGYTPPQLRGAYGVSGSGLDGTGTTVAITDAYFAGTIVSDANTYVSKNDPGSPSLVEGQNFFQSIPPSFSHTHLCNADGWPGEETLDVEAVHGIAPQATVKYFAAASCEDTDFIDALARVVSDGSVDVVSNSWAGFETQETPGITAAYETVFMQGILEGMTFSFSSGDDGDELAASGTKQVDYPSSDPFVTAAGGTSIGIGSDGNFAGQTGWGTMKATLNTTSGTWNTPAFLYGAGGGCSGLFSEPAYQSGTNADGCNSRGVPDISMDADPNTGFLIGETQTFPHHVVEYDQYRIGGTSLASPLFAGMLALADQKAGASIAEANVLLYSLGSGIVDVQAQGQAGALPDQGNVRADYANGVDASGGTVYSVRIFDQDSSLSTGTGWDQVTGLGTLNGGTISALAQAAP